MVALLEIFHPDILLIRSASNKRTIALPIPAEAPVTIATPFEGFTEIELAMFVLLLEYI